MKGEGTNLIRITSMTAIEEKTSHTHMPIHGHNSSHLSLTFCSPILRRSSIDVVDVLAIGRGSVCGCAWAACSADNNNDDTKEKQHEWGCWKRSIEARRLFFTHEIIPVKFKSIPFIANTPSLLMRAESQSRYAARQTAACPRTRADSGSAKSRKGNGVNVNRYVSAWNEDEVRHEWQKRDLSLI